MRPRGRNNVWPLRGQIREAGRPQDCLSLSHSSTLFAYSLFFSAPQSTQWENGPPPHPQGPLITDRATCKDRSDLLPSQLLRGENLSVWPSPSQVSSVSGPVTSGPVTSGQGTAWWGAGDHRTGAASREGGSWRPPSGADPSEGLHPQLPVQRSHEPGLAFWQISSGSRSWRVSDREGWTQSLTTKLSMVNPLKETRTE